MKRIALFASGSGSNAENIARYFAGNGDVDVSLLLTNNPKAGVIDRVRPVRRSDGFARPVHRGVDGSLHLPVLLFDRPTFYDTDRITQFLQQQRIDLVVLAGFMWLMPPDLVRAFPDRIINIHPALLPKYGGKGMYGHFVHEAVVAAGEAESGITIHYINERYDEGQLIFQASCPVLPTDTPEDVARHVQALEQAHYPPVIADVLARL